MINQIFDTSNVKINTIIIENPDFFYGLITDIQKQIAGFSGQSILSKDDKILPFYKNAECLTSYFPFEINHKNLINVAKSHLETLALDAKHYEQAMHISNMLENFLLDLSVEMTGDIEFTKTDISNILKSCGLTFVDTSESLAEAIINYMELTRAYDHDKVFFTVNLRSFVNDHDIDLFFQTILQHQYHLIMLENKEYHHVNNENRYVIDKDLCEIY